MPKVKNICIIASSLGVGGAEKVAALQSEMLQDLGYKVFIVSVLNHIEYPYAGTLLNLGLLKDKRDTFFDGIHRLFVLKRFLNNNDIDLIIDHRSRNHNLREFLLKFIVFRTKVIFMVHSMNLEKSFSENKLISRFLYKNASCLVSVSKAIEEKSISVYGFSNVKTIYNAFKKEILLVPGNVAESDIYILFFGRLDEEAKDLSFLINAYHKSSLPLKGVQLILLGSGPDSFKLHQLVLKLQLIDSIIFVEHTNNPFPYVRNAKFTVLTSNFEGFPMSIIESLACETPVVAVDNISGPRELIRGNYNGLLVEKSLVTYAEALDRMISDTELLATCKKNSLESIQHLSYSNIKKEWGALIESL
jgi:glycosyltransferase involved in cell wall biosynthesis